MALTPSRITSPGELRERVAFQRRITANDGYGNTVTSDWVEYYRCSARITPLKGGEDVIARRLAGVQPVIITVRVCSNLADLTMDDRAVDTRKGTIFNLRSSANFDEDKQMLEMLAESGVAT